MHKSKENCINLSMSVLLILIPVSVLVAICGLIAFIWNVKAGQYEDIKGSANRILFEDDNIDQGR